MTNVTEDGLDAEGKAVLDELQKEGFEIAGREPAAADPAPEAKPAPEIPKVEPEKPKVEPEIKPELDENGKPKAKINDPAPERKPQYVPLPKYLQTEKDLKDAQAKIQELTKSGAKPSEAAIGEATDAVKELVEKFGYEEDDAKKLVDVFKHLIPGQTVTPEMQRAMDALPLLDKMKADLEKQQETAGFETDFVTSVVKEFPHLDKYKDQIKEMAYSETYANTPLRTVALQFMHDEGISQSVADVITTDKAGGGTNKGAGEEVDFANITDEQFSKLTPEQQDKFFAFQDSKERAARGALN